ncbi:MAG: T9SS type A sorting domain-containing protein, partial [Bacteroidia bacterium]|nr:T9SS type A sorting domain-containing protein [Bacteroidia bacterium]
VPTQTMSGGITLSNLSSGVYIVSVTTNNNTIIDKKIIID